MADMADCYMLIELKKSPYYKAEFKHYEIIVPDMDNIPPILDFSRERALSFFDYDFLAKCDEDAISMARQHADDLYRSEREDLPRGKKSLANKPILHRLYEIRPPRRVKI